MGWSRAGTRLRLIKRTLYRLKRDYGIPADIYRNVQGTRDLETGATGDTQTVLRLRRLIVLPVLVKPQFEYDLTMIGANKNFTYGGIFEAGDRKIIIDAEDLPVGHIIEETDYLVFEAQRYNIFRVREVVPHRGFTMYARRVQQQKPLQQLAPTLVPSTLGVGQTVTGVVV